MTSDKPPDLDGYTLATCLECETVVSVLDNSPVDIDLHRARIRPHRCLADDLEDAGRRQAWRMFCLDMREQGYQVLAGQDAIDALLDRMEAYLIR